MENGINWAQLKSAAIRYGNLGKIPNPTITTDKNTYNFAYDSNVNIFGPFKATLSKRTHIKSITVKHEDGRVITNGLSFYSDANGKNRISNMEDIKGDFYIKSTATKALGSMTIEVETDDIYSGELWTLLNEKDDQRLLIVDTSTTRKTKTINVKINIVNTRLTINKIDSSDKKNITDSKAKFKIKAPTGKWLKGNNGSFTYSDSEAGGETYETNSNGQVVLTKLQNMGTYQIKEIEAPQGYKISTGTKNIAIELENPTPSIDFENEAAGSITINKIDSVTKSKITNLSTKFKIKTPKGKWLKGRAGAYTYSNTEAGADEYLTVNGSLKLTTLPLGTYTVKETTPPTGYLITTTTRDIEIKTSNLTPTINIENTPTGGFTITKKDAKTGKVIKSVTKFRVKTASNKYLKGSEGSYSYNNSTGDVYATTDGIFKLEKLQYGTYIIEEVTPPTGYELSATTLSIVINSPNVDIQETFYNTPYGSLTIYKHDEEDTTKKGLNAGFKIQVDGKGWLANTNAPYNYSATFEEATTYYLENRYGKSQSITFPISSSQYGNGLKIDKLRDGTYKVFEVKAPDGYLLDRQPGYKEEKVKVNGKEVIRKYADIGNNVRTISFTTSNNTTGSNVEMNLSNVKKVSIEGYVWIDTPPTKGENYNSVFDNKRESTVSGVTVCVKSKKDKQTLKIKNNEYVVETDENGKYLLEQVLKKSELKDYYVEFNYKGEKVTRDPEGNELKEDTSKYIPVAFNSTEKNRITENGSRALMEKHEYEDYKETNNTGIATTYKGTDKENICGLSENGILYEKLFDKSTKTVKNINLGIKKILSADYRLNQNLEYVLIKVNGFSYKYIYGKKGDSSIVTAPKVSFQNKTNISGYSAYIYPSDIMYNNTEVNKQLQVEVGYRIDIENLCKTNIEELYKEKTLKITSLTDKFDTSRYTLSDESKLNWNMEEEGTAKYKNNIEIGPYQTDIDTKSIPITFNVKREAMLAMLDKEKNPNGIIDEFPVTAYTIGYHEYTRNDYSWEKNIFGEGVSHRTKDDQKEQSAPYLIFRLGKDRVIKGKVFEDKENNKQYESSGEKLGNGQYDDNENLVVGAKVELLEINGDKNTPTRLYPESVISDFNADKDNYTGIEATTHTKSGAAGENGTYEFSGLIPGYYYLRFTYGNGEQKIYDTTGKEIKTLNAKDYKSTIITNTDAKTALQKDTDGLWYKNIKDDENPSVAKDDLSTRKTVNEGTSNNIIAEAAKICITVEKTSGDSTEIEVKDGKQIELAKNEFNGLSFGIIEVPKQDVEIRKIITNVKLTNSQGNVLYSGNPENVPSQGVVALSDLDNEKNGGSTYVRAEVNEDSIYGADLELTYEVIITNKSDVNYYYDRYYWFGDKTDNKEVTVKLTDVKDYLDETLTYEKEKSDQDRINSLGMDNISVDGKTIRAQKMNLKFDDHVLYTNKIANRDNGHPTSNKVKIVASRVLSNQDDDMEIVSRAVIDGAETSPDEKDTSADKTEQIKIAPKEVHTNGMVKARFIITPPTGKNRSTTTYIITGIIALIGLGIGIVVLKKKVC